MLSHIYIVPGNHQVKITGDFPAIFLGGTSIANNQKLKRIDQRGDIQRKSMNNAFKYSRELQILATDTPNLQHVTDMSYMFHEATNVTGNFSGRVLGKVTNMG